MAHKHHELVEGRPAEDIMGKLNWLHLSLTCAPDEHLIEAARSAFESLRDVVSPEGEPLFPELAVYFVRFDRALTRRAAFPRVMLRVEEEPAMLTARPTPMAANRLVFGSASSLMEDLYLTRDAYLAPLFLCHSPYIWAIVGPRAQGVMVVSLGKPLPGREADAAELLQQFLPAGPPAFPACPPFTAGQITATLAWWADRLNSVLSVLTDPATYADSAGRYSPRAQFEAQLTFEQAGRRIQATLAQQRDQHSRRLMTFGALDTLEGGISFSLDEAVKLSRAQKVLDGLEAMLPPEVAAVLLPSARRAVQALRGCQQGFISSGWVSGGRVTLPDKKLGRREWSLEDATAAYLRVLRNASHGYSGQNDKDRRRDEVLLMSHTGEIPHDFALLPYLYWLETLAHPETLRNKLKPR